MANINYEFEQGFTKPGASRFSSNEFALNLSSASIQVQNQVKKLGPELEKYSNISSDIRYRLKNEMTKINDVRYMNMEYLAATLSILESMKTEGYSSEDFEEYMIEFLNNDKKFEPYYKKILSVKKEQNSGYKNLVKKVIFSYAYKINEARK
jgi:hypothetical protein